MRFLQRPIWHWLDRSSPLLFLLGGMTIVIGVSLGGISVFTTLSVPDLLYWPFWTAGIGLSLGALFGLYRRVIPVHRWLGWSGAAFAGAGALLLLGGTAVLLVRAPPGPYPEALGLLGAPFFFGLVAFVPAFGLAGMSNILPPEPSRLTGGLLLGLSILQFGELTTVIVVLPGMPTHPTADFYLIFQSVVYGTMAAGIAGLGYLQRMNQAPTKSVENSGTTV